MPEPKQQNKDRKWSKHTKIKPCVNVFLWISRYFHRSKSDSSDLVVFLCKTKISVFDFWNHFCCISLKGAICRFCISSSNSWLMVIHPLCIFLVASIDLYYRVLSFTETNSVIFIFFLLIEIVFYFEGEIISLPVSATDSHSEQLDVFLPFPPQFP